MHSLDREGPITRVGGKVPQLLNRVGLADQGVTLNDPLHVVGEIAHLELLELGGRALVDFSPGEVIGSKEGESEVGRVVAEVVSLLGGEFVSFPGKGGKFSLSFPVKVMEKVLLVLT